MATESIFACKPLVAKVLAFLRNPPRVNFTGRGHLPIVIISMLNDLS